MPLIIFKLQLRRKNEGMNKSKYASPWAIIIYIGIICMLASIGTWTGDFLGTPSIDDNYYHQESTCRIDNVSYHYNIWFGMVTESTDGFFVLQDIKLYVTEGYIEFRGNVTPMNKNISVILVFSPPIREGGSFYGQSDPIKTRYDENKKRYEFYPTGMIFDYPVSEQKHLMPVVMENRTVIDGGLDDYTFVEVQPAYMKTQLNLTKVAVILTYWVIYLAILTAIFEYKRTINKDKNNNSEELGNEEKNMWERLNKVRSKTWNLFFSIAIIIGIFILFNGAIASFNHQYTETSVLVTVGLGLISIGIAFISLNLANESDKKMRAISELNFVEKNAMIYGYIDNLEGLKDSQIMAVPSSTTDNKTVSNDILKKMIRDLDSALIVIDYISEETRNKFLYAFRSFSKAIKDHVIAFKDDDIKDYLRIIGLVERYQFEDKEKAIDNLKKILEEKLSNKVT